MCKYSDEYYYEYADECDDECDDEYYAERYEEDLEFHYEQCAEDYSGGYTESDFGCEEEYLEYLEWGDD